MPEEEKEHPSLEPELFAAEEQKTSLSAQKEENEEAASVLRQALRVIEQNFYLVFALVFLVWMLFVDGNDFVNQYRNYRQIKNLEAQREFYQTRIKEIEAQRRALRTDLEKIEEYAREEYLLQKKGEEVFIIERE